MSELLTTPFTVNKAKRVFKFNNTELNDPSDSLTPQEVVNFYTMTYTELNTATIDAGVLNLEKGEIVYTISKTLGTKG